MNTEVFLEWINKKISVHQRMLKFCKSDISEMEYMSKLAAFQECLEFYKTCP